MTAPNTGQAANQAKTQSRPFVQQLPHAQQAQSLGALGGAGAMLGSTPSKPLLAEISSRLAANIGAAVDAGSKMRQRLDEILGAEPPRGGPPQGNGSVPPATQAGSLMQQCQTLAEVLIELHNQIDRLGAI